MKTTLITFISFVFTLVFLMTLNSTTSYANSGHSNYKACKHNGNTYAIIPINNTCVYNHEQMSSLPVHHSAKHSHLCILTEEPISGL